MNPVTLNTPLGGNFGAVLSNRRRWTIVGLLTAASFINYLDRATISVALPLISADLGLNPTTKGVLLSAFFWSYALAQVPMGWCVDRFNLRWLYAGAFAFWSIALWLNGVRRDLRRAPGTAGGAGRWGSHLPARGRENR